MHGTFDYQTEQKADRSGHPFSGEQVDELLRWMALAAIALVGLVIGAFLGLVTGLASGLIDLC